SAGPKKSDGSAGVSDAPSALTIIPHGGRWLPEGVAQPRTGSDTPTRPGYKCHPGAGRGTTCRMIDVLRFVVGLAAERPAPPRRSRRRKRAAPAAAHRGAAQDRGAGPLGTVAALHDGGRRTPGAGVARRHVARPAG